MMKHPKAVVAIDWLNKQPMAQELAVQARRLASLQQEVDRCAPVKGLLVTSFEQSVLVLTTQSASMAAKFRQFERSLITKLAEGGWRIERIRIRPQPSAFAPPPVPAVPKEPVPRSALEAIDALRNQSDDGALRDALSRLLRNQQRRHHQD